MIIHSPLLSTQQRKDRLPKPINGNIQPFALVANGRAL
jgi:hypothetical protein